VAPEAEGSSPHSQQPANDPTICTIILLNNEVYFTAVNRANQGNQKITFYFLL
jgi:hypothetical protein